MGRFRVAALALMFFFLGASPAPAQRATSIEGRVRSGNGQIISRNVTVRLVTVEGVAVSNVKTGSDGRFLIYNLNKISYRLIVEAEGHRSHEQIVKMYSVGGRVSVEIFLTPIAEAARAPKDPPSLTDQAAPKEAHKQYENAQQALSRHETPSAQAYLEKAVALYPCYARARADLALVYLSLKDYTGAESMLGKAVECDPDFVPSYGLLASLFNSQKRFEESEKVLQEGLRRAPGDGWLHELLGTAYYMEGRDAPAEAELLRAFSFNPKDPGELHAKLAAVYLRSKTYQRAYAEMHAYLQAEPDGRFAVRLRNIMRQLEAEGKARSEEPQASPLANTKP